MNIHFYKYHGTGNDFLLLDNRRKEYDKLTNEQVASLCQRHFSIGADGLMLLNEKDGYDFEMMYYNSDGNVSSMCGNGGRCISAFAQRLGIGSDELKFLATDGEHISRLKNGIISLQMKDVDRIIHRETYSQVDTGSPHYVAYVDDVNDIKVKQEGALIRYSPLFKEEGINVNFMQELSPTSIFVRTYERGVEDETLSCGTGVTACALVQMEKEKRNLIQIKTLGGELEVEGQKKGEGFENVWLTGPAEFVFEGEVQV